MCCVSLKAGVSHAPAIYALHIKAEAFALNSNLCMFCHKLISAPRIKSTATVVLPCCFPCHVVRSRSALETSLEELT